MGQLKENKILKSIASYLNVQNNAELDELIKKKVCISELGFQNPFTCSTFSFFSKDAILDDDKSDLIWTVLHLTKKKRSSLLGSTYEDEIIVRQWLEYASTHLSNIASASSNDTHSMLKVIIPGFIIFANLSRV